MADRIQIRRDTASNWTSANPVLADGEIGWERDTNQFKVGNGTTAWNSLSYGGIKGDTGPQGEQGDPGPTGDTGDTGPAGSPGAPGATGATGPAGADGQDGRTILYGTSAPTTEGEDGDFYIRTTTNFIYGPKAGGTWPAGVSLAGPQGPAGAPGADGADGADGTTGIGVPAGGTAGQVLTKTSATDYATTWADQQITVSATAPASPTLNQLWLDIS